MLPSKFVTIIYTLIIPSFDYIQPQILPLLLNEARINERMAWVSEWLSKWVSDSEWRRNKWMNERMSGWIKERRNWWKINLSYFPIYSWESCCKITAVYFSLPSRRPCFTHTHKRKNHTCKIIKIKHFSTIVISFIHQQTYFYDNQIFTCHLHRTLWDIFRDGRRNVPNIVL